MLRNPTGRATSAFVVLALAAVAGPGGDADAPDCAIMRRELLGDLPRNAGTPPGPPTCRSAATRATSTC